MTRTIQQLFDLTGKTALVTGGSRGLGLQLAHALGDCRREVVTAIKQGLAQGSAGTLTEALRHERQLAARLRGST